MGVKYFSWGRMVAGLALLASAVLWVPETGVLPFLIGISLAMVGTFTITGAWRERHQRFAITGAWREGLDGSPGETRRVRFSIARIALWNRFNVVGVVGIVHTLYVLLF